MHKCKSPSELSPASWELFQETLPESISPSAKVTPATPARMMGFFRRARKAGFSLIEVSMALAIVGICFVALIGLLPAGMKVFDAAINETAQTRMVAHLSSLLQAADYTNFKTGNYTSTLYYYDVDGSYVDSDAKTVAGAEAQRVYAAKVVLDTQNIPTGGTNFDREKTATRVILAMGRYEAPVMEKLRSLTTGADIQTLTSKNRIKTQPVLITRMDVEPQ